MNNTNEIIMNCDVSANSIIRINGRKGLINGGTLRAGTGIEAENIGTEMGTFTRLEVGIDPSKKKKAPPRALEPPHFVRTAQKRTPV